MPAVEVDNYAAARPNVHRSDETHHDVPKIDWRFAGARLAGALGTIIKLRNFQAALLGRITPGINTPQIVI
jgi:hypothetical protein